MRSSQMVRDLRKGLLREGIPMSYVERVIQELADHAEDIEMEFSPMPLSFSERSAMVETRLGCSENMVFHLASAYRMHTFAGRHCLLWSLGAPIVAMFLSMISLLLIGCAGMRVVYDILDHTVANVWANTALYFLVYGSAAVLPLLVTGFWAAML